MTSERIQRTIDTLLGQCEEAARRGDWGLVLETAKRVLRLDPQHEDANAFVRMAEDERETPQTGHIPRRAHAAESRFRLGVERWQSDLPKHGISPTFAESAGQGPKSKAPTLYVVYSSASADEEYKEELKKHLRNLKREGVLFFNPPDYPIDDDSRLPHHEDDVADRFGKADVILLLVSPDYLDAALQKGPKKLEFDLALLNLEQRRSAVHVVPVILRKCSWDSVPELGDLCQESPIQSSDLQERNRPGIDGFIFNGNGHFQVRPPAIARWLEGLVKQRTGATEGLEKKKRPESAMRDRTTSVGVANND